LGRFGEDFVLVGSVEVTTPRGVMVAPANWSNSPPSFLTFHFSSAGWPS